MNMIDMNVLRDLTNAFGPSGFEEDVVRAVRKHCTGMSLTNDAMNNVYARIGGNAEAESLFLCWMPIQMSADLWYRGSWKMVC